MPMTAPFSEPEPNSSDHGDAMRDRPLIVRSEELFQGRREVWIEHGDDMYRLRLTKAGKLFLTK